MNGFILYCIHASAISKLSDEDAGQLFKALFAYVRDGTLPELGPAADMAFQFIKEQLDIDAAKYERTCEKNRENIRKRWEKNSKAYGRIQGVQPNTNDTYNNNNNNHNNNNDLPHTVISYINTGSIAEALDIDDAWRFNGKARTATAQRLTRYIHDQTGMHGNVLEVVDTALKYGVTPQEIVDTARESRDFCLFSGSLMGRCVEG